MRILDIIAIVLLIIGGINWGLIGLFDFNLVAAIFQFPALITLIYILVGLSAIYKAFRCMSHCRSCAECHHSMVNDRIGDDRMKFDNSNKFDDTNKPLI